MKAVPITDISKNSISAADIIADPIIGTSQIIIKANAVRLWIVNALGSSVVP